MPPLALLAAAIENPPLKISNPFVLNGPTSPIVSFPRLFKFLTKNEPWQVTSTGTETTNEFLSHFQTR